MVDVAWAVVLLLALVGLAVSGRAGFGLGLRVVAGGFLIMFIGRIVAHQIANARECRRMDRGRCRQCGYDLRGSTDRCPECGRHFPPGDKVKLGRDD